MPWIRETRSGPNSFAAAIGGSRYWSHWTVDVYKPVEEAKLDELMGDITGSLCEGKVTCATEAIDRIIDDVLAETQLVQGLKRARKNLGSLLSVDAALQKLKDTVGEDALESASSGLQKKLIKSAGPEIDRLKKIPLAYFGFRDSVYSFLSSVSRRERAEIMDSALQQIPEIFRPEVQDAFDKFQKSEKHLPISEVYPNFLKLVESCASIAGRYVGDINALAGDTSTAAAFQILRLPMKISLVGEECRKREELCGYVCCLPGQGSDDDHSWHLYNAAQGTQMVLIPELGMKSTGSYAVNEQNIQIKRIAECLFIPSGDERKRIGKENVRPVDRRSAV